LRRGLLIDPTPQNVEVSFKRSVLLNQFLLTRRGLSPLFGFFHGAYDRDPLQRKVE
jgi:hypothetical protein